jgi:hypothetical protein
MVVAIDGVEFLFFSFIFCITFQTADNFCLNYLSLSFRMPVRPLSRLRIVGCGFFFHNLIFIHWVY